MSLDVKVRHRFGSFGIDVDFSAPPGVIALYGRSGAGKTSVVNAIAGLLKPAEGRIVANGTCLLDTASGTDIPVHKRRIGYVFQDSRLLPHLTIRQNLQFGRWFSGLTLPQGELSRIVDILGIEDLLDRRPGGLSGGEKQRVAIGRALLSAPRLLLMDEPLAALDEARKAEILHYLERIRDELKLPMFYVSHAVAEVARLATTIIALDNGCVVKQGPTASVLSDPDAFPLMGRQEAGSILSAIVIGHDNADGLSELEISGGRLITPLIPAEPGALLRVRVRARDIILALREPEETSALNVLPATVHRVGRIDGPIVDVAIRCGQDDVLARITRRSLVRLGLEPGKSCFIILKSIAVTRRDVGIIDGHEL
ncbi:MAG: molybdenum ABC transporter ATP-binding protein [Hyphomicrobiaceae bacterium]